MLKLYFIPFGRCFVMFIVPEYLLTIHQVITNKIDHTRFFRGSDLGVILVHFWNVAQQGKITQRQHGATRQKQVGQKTTGNSFEHSSQR